MQLCPLGCRGQLHELGASADRSAPREPRKRLGQRDVAAGENLGCVCARDLRHHEGLQACPSRLVPAGLDRCEEVLGGSHQIAL